MKTPAWEQSIQEVLAQFGQAVSVSRVSIFVEEFGVRLAWVGQAQPNGSVRLLAIHPSESTPPRMVTVR